MDSVGLCVEKNQWDLWNENLDIEIQPELYTTVVNSLYAVKRPKSPKNPLHRWITHQNLNPLYITLGELMCSIFKYISEKNLYHHDNNAIIVCDRSLHSALQLTHFWNAQLFSILREKKLDFLRGPISQTMPIYNLSPIIEDSHKLQQYIIKKPVLYSLLVPYLNHPPSAQPCSATQEEIISAMKNYLRRGNDSNMVKRNPNNPHIISILNDPLRYILKKSLFHVNQLWDILMEDSIETILVPAGGKEDSKNILGGDSIKKNITPSIPFKNELNSIPEESNNLVISSDEEEITVNEDCISVKSDILYIDTDMEEGAMDNNTILSI